MSIITGVTIHNAKLKHKNQIYRFQRKKLIFEKELKKLPKVYTKRMHMKLETSIRFRGTKKL